MIKDKINFNVFGASGAHPAHIQRTSGGASGGHPVSIMETSAGHPQGIRRASVEYPKSIRRASMKAHLARIQLASKFLTVVRGPSIRLSRDRPRPIQRLSMVYLLPIQGLSNYAHPMPIHRPSTAHPLPIHGIHSVSIVLFI